MSSDNWSQIKESLKIVDVLKHLNLPHEHKRGKMLCPIHQEKNPSFSIYDDGRRFKCFGCGAAGDVGDLYEALMQCDKKQAYKDLCVIAGIETGSSGSLFMYGKVKNKTLPRVARAFKKVENMFPHMRGGEIVHCHNKQLWEWAERKNIHQDVVYQCLMDGDLDLEDGLMVFVYNTGRKKRFDWDSSRGNRWIDGGAEGGLWRYKEVTNSNKHVIIMCEGESDAMRILSLLPRSCPSVGVVAIPSASWIPDSELAMLIGMNRDVVIWFDGDEAGEKAEWRTMSALSNVPGCRVFAATISSKDICEESEENLRKELDKILTLT